jgi:hypothetical protein
MANNFQERVQRIVDRKVTLAKEADAWVVRVRTPDSRMILRIVRDADRGIRILRGGILLRYKAEEVVPLLNEYFEAVKRLNEAAEKICKKAGVPYIAPRELQPKKVGDLAGEADAKIEKKMEVAYSKDGDENEEDIMV